MSAQRFGFSIRLTKSQCGLVAEYARGLGLPEYQARLRLFECGLAAVFSSQPDKADMDGLTLLAEIMDRLQHLERLAERTLYTSATAYTFASYAAHRGTNNSQSLNETLSEASMDAYRRQLEIARGEK
jgi:hypothetical protein